MDLLAVLEKPSTKESHLVHPVVQNACQDHSSTKPASEVLSATSMDGSCLFHISQADLTPWDLPVFIRAFTSEHTKIDCLLLKVAMNGTYHCVDSFQPKKGGCSNEGA